MEERWTARWIQPTVILYVLGVFGAFMLMAHFVFHSPDAVKALFAAAAGSVVGLAAGVMTRVEYRLTEAGMAKRTFKAKQTKEFEALFTWEELTHIVPTSSGFKYYKRLDEKSAIRRFWKLHISSDSSGEVRVEPEDRDRVMGIIRERGIPLGRPGPSGRIGSSSS